MLASDLTLGAVYVQGQVGMDWQSDGVYGVSARYLAGFGTDGFDVWPHVEARAELVLQF